VEALKASPSNDKMVSEKCVKETDRLCVWADSGFSFQHRVPPAPGMVSIVCFTPSTLHFVDSDADASPPRKVAAKSVPSMKHVIFHLDCTQDLK